MPSDIAQWPIGFDKFALVQLEALLRKAESNHLSHKLVQQPGWPRHYLVESSTLAHAAAVQYEHAHLALQSDANAMDLDQQAHDDDLHHAFMMGASGKPPAGPSPARPNAFSHGASYYGGDATRPGSAYPRSGHDPHSTKPRFRESLSASRTPPARPSMAPPNNIVSEWAKKRAAAGLSGQTNPNPNPDPDQFRLRGALHGVSHPDSRYSGARGFNSNGPRGSTQPPQDHQKKRVLDDVHRVAQTAAISTVSRSLNQVASSLRHKIGLTKDLLRSTVDSVATTDMPTLKRQLGAVMTSLETVLLAQTPPDVKGDFDKEFQYLAALEGGSLTPERVESKQHWAVHALQYAAATGVPISGDVAQTYIDNFESFSAYECSVDAPDHCDTGLPHDSTWLCYDPCAEYLDQSSISLLHQLGMCAYRSVFGQSQSTEVLDTGTSCNMTKNASRMLGGIVVWLDDAVDIHMGKGEVQAHAAGLMVTCQRRDPDDLSKGVYTDVSFTLQVPFSSDDITPHSSTQNVRAGIGFDTGVSSGNHGCTYSVSEPSPHDLPGLAVNPRTGCVRREAALGKSAKLSVPTLDTEPLDEVLAKNIPHFDLRSGGRMTTKIASENTLNGARGTKHYKTAVELLFKCSPFLDECFGAPDTSDPDPLLVAPDSSFFAHGNSRTSATSRVSATASKATRAVSSALNSAASSRTLATALTLAVICGGMCMAGSSEFTDGLQLNVVHFVESDPLLCQFVAGQCPDAMMHHFAWSFLEHLKDGTIACARLGTAAPLGVLEITGPCRSPALLGAESFETFTDVYRGDHKLFLLGLECIDYLLPVTVLQEVSSSCFDNDQDYSFVINAREGKGFTVSFSYRFHPHVPRLATPPTTSVSS